MGIINGKERLPYLDYARVFAAFLMIFGHVLPSNDTIIRPYIYSFHMPLFFIISGMLHKDLGYIAWKKYFRTLIIPFISFNLLFFVLWPIFWKVGIWNGGPSYIFAKDTSIWNISLHYTGKIVIDIVSGKGGPDGPTWFLLALFWCKIATDLLCKHKYMPYISILLLIGVVSIALYPKPFMQIGNALMALPFFYGGFRYKDIIQKWCTKNLWILAICLLLINIPATMTNGNISIYAISYGQVMLPLNVLIFYTNAFAVSLGILSLCMRLHKNNIITTSAKALITILCVHIAFVRIIGRIQDVPLCLLASFLIFIVCVLIHQYLERRIPFAVGKNT